MISSMLLKFSKEEEGQDLVEYSLLLAFIALAAVALLGGVGGSIKSIYATINNTLSSTAVVAS